jgi:adenylate kinase
MSKKPAILILGAPGSGKGTQGVALGKLPKFFHCACGDVFRALDTRSDLGKKFVEYSSKGQLVPDEFTIELWRKQIDNWRDSQVYFPDCDILVLDGIPRNVEQARILSDYVEVHQVFHLSCPDRGELARRMRKRALHSNRIDDANEDVIQDRIRTYEAETKPIIDFYDDDLITEIDAAQEPVKVMHDMVSRIISLSVYEEMKSVVL